MEIRRCDKCKNDINLADIQKLTYCHGELKGLTLELPTMASRSEQRELRRQEGLDDNDVFENNITKKDIDLCENCVVEFASMMKVWLANSMVATS